MQVFVFLKNNQPWCFQLYWNQSEGVSPYVLLPSIMQCHSYKNKGVNCPFWCQTALAMWNPSLIREGQCVKQGWSKSRNCSKVVDYIPVMELVPSLAVCCEV